jgi:hypothetical protein
MSESNDPDYDECINTFVKCFVQLGGELVEMGMVDLPTALRELTWFLENDDKCVSTSLNRTCRMLVLCGAASSILEAKINSGVGDDVLEAVVENKRSLDSSFRETCEIFVNLLVIKVGPQMANEELRLMVKDEVKKLARDRKERN